MPEPNDRQQALGCPVNLPEASITHKHGCGQGWLISCDVIPFPYKAVAGKGAGLVLISFAKTEFGYQH